MHGHGKQKTQALLAVCFSFCRLLSFVHRLSRVIKHPSTLVFSPSSATGSSAPPWLLAPKRSLRYSPSSRNTHPRVDMPANAMKAAVPKPATAPAKTRVAPSSSWGAEYQEQRRADQEQGHRGEEAESHHSKQRTPDGRAHQGPSKDRSGRDGALGPNHEPPFFYVLLLCDSHPPLYFTG